MRPSRVGALVVELLARSGLPGNPKAFEPGSPAGSVGFNHLFEQSDHLFCRLRPDRLPDVLGTVGLEQRPLAIPDVLDDIRPHQHPIVGQSSKRDGQLQRSDRHPVAETHRGQLDIRPVPIRGQQARTLGRQINPTGLAQTKRAQIPEVGWLTEPLDDFGRPDITRVLDDLGKAQPAVRSMVLDRPPTDPIATLFTKDLLLGVYQPTVQCGCGQQGLEGRAGLIDLADQPIATVCGRCGRRVVGIETRHLGHGQDGKAAGIENDDRAGLGRMRLNRPGQFVLGDVLQSGIEAEANLEGPAGCRVHTLGKNHPAKGVAQSGQFGRSAAQIVVIGLLDAGQPLGINIGEAEEWCGQTALRIDPPFTRLTANPVNTQAANLGRQLGRDPTL